MQLGAGPLQHFQQRPVQPSTRTGRETRQTREEAAAAGPPATPFANSAAADAGADILVAWRCEGPTGEAAVGAVHLLDCRMQVWPASDALCEERVLTVMDVQALLAGCMSCWPSKISCVPWGLPEGGGKG